MTAFMDERVVKTLTWHSSKKRALRSHSEMIGQAALPSPFLRFSNRRPTHQYGHHENYRLSTVITKTLNFDKKGGNAHGTRPMNSRHPYRDAAVRVTSLLTIIWRSIMRANGVHCCRNYALFSLLTSLMLVLLICGPASGVSLPLNYEADVTWPLSPWSADAGNPLVSIQPSGGILTIDKYWPYMPHVLYRVHPLDFTSSEGVVIEARLKLCDYNKNPIWLSVTDESYWLAYLHIYPDRIQRHEQNNLTPLETRMADFTKWRTITVVFKSRHMLLFLDGKKIMDSDITGIYAGDYPCDVIFGIPGGVQLLNQGPSCVQLDYLRIMKLNTPAVDIKPGSCPNPLNIEDNGILPVAILGSAGFDVFAVDPASIRLMGVAPLRSSYEDVAMPVSAGAAACECTQQGPDGFLDLSLKFDAQQVIAALGEVNDGDILELTLTATLDDGTQITGKDCVRIISKGMTP